MQNVDQIVECIMQIVECRMQNVECRMQIVECMARLKWTKTTQNQPINLKIIEIGGIGEKKNVECRLQSEECRVKNVDCRMDGQIEVNKDDQKSINKPENN